MKINCWKCQHTEQIRKGQEVLPKDNSCIFFGLLCCVLMSKFYFVLYLALGLYINIYILKSKWMPASVLISHYQLILTNNTVIMRPLNSTHTFIKGIPQVLSYECTNSGSLPMPGPRRCCWSASYIKAKWVRFHFNSYTVNLKSWKAPKPLNHLFAMLTKLKCFVRKVVLI